MTLKNVEKMDQTQVEKSWFNRFRQKIGATVLTTGVLVASNAHAADGDIPDFLAPAKTAIAGIGLNLGTLFIACIGIALVIIAFTLSKGGIKRAG